MPCLNPWMALDFGYYPYHQNIHASDITLSELPGPSIVSSGASRLGARTAERCARCSGDIHLLPNNARVFALPMTHRIEHACSEDVGRLRFLVQCFGFFQGMRWRQERTVSIRHR